MIRVVLALVALSIMVTFTLQCTEKSARNAQLLEEKRVSDSIARIDSIADAEAKRYCIKETSIGAGEGLFQAMGRLNIEKKQALKIINKLRFQVELVNLKAGEKFIAKFTNDTTKLLEFDYSPYDILTHRIIIDTATGELTYKKDEKSTQKNYRLVKGVLKENSTLNQSLLDAGFSEKITQVVNGILLCKIAFRTDARVNDSFSVLLQEESYNGKKIPERTKVLYTSYKGVRTGFHEAYRYSEDDSKSTYNAHYTPLGEALIHSGLRYPVDRIHISSTYGWRIHPITGKRKMHYGVDYCGPVGTSVYAVAAGVVVKSSSDPLSGNKIAIRHSDRSTTYYLHLSRRLVSKGQRVRARQIIGKMGVTGRVTGPHLHFAVKRPNGKWMNPLQKRMIATPKLKGERLARLQGQIKEINRIKRELEKKDLVVKGSCRYLTLSADSLLPLL